MSLNAWRRLRLTTQVLMLVLFLYLLVGTKQELATLLPHDLFLRLDPLAGLTAMLAGRRWVLPMALGAVTLLLTLGLGRVWCGWLCPLGTLLDWTPSRRPLPKETKLHDTWRKAKHLVLFIVLFAAALGSLTFMIIDPITLLSRTCASILLPGLNYIVTTIEIPLYGIAPFRPALDWFHYKLWSPLSLGQPFFWPNLLLASVFTGILVLNAIRVRFWCRYLCPLGAFLALVSRVSWMRYVVDAEACVPCLRCVGVCPTGAIDPVHQFADPAECVSCLKCLDICNKGAISFSSHFTPAKWQPYDPSRRQALTALGLAVAGTVVLPYIPTLPQARQLAIRPPGASEDNLLSRCIRCNECVKVCPTGGLQPAFLAGTWESLWTPVLVARLGYCDYSCNACGQVCPTGAIPELSLEEKRQAVIGVASIDEERCLAWAESRDCTVCEEMCPAPEKAVLLEDHAVEDENGLMRTIRRPKVLKDRCIGCGICEYQCPVEGESAIRIFASGIDMPHGKAMGMRLAGFACSDREREPIHSASDT